MMSSFWYGKERKLCFLTVNEFLDLCLLTNLVSEIVQFGSSYAALSDNLNSLDTRGMQGENPFDSDTIRDLSYDKRTTDTTIILGKYDSFKDLNTFVRPFNNLKKYLYGITNTEVFSVFLHLF